MQPQSGLIAAVLGDAAVWVMQQSGWSSVWVMQRVGDCSSVGGECSVVGDEQSVG